MTTVCAVLTMLYHAYCPCAAFTMPNVPVPGLRCLYYVYIFLPCLLCLYYAHYVFAMPIMLKQCRILLYYAYCICDMMTTTRYACASTMHGPYLHFAYLYNVSRPTTILRMHVIRRLCLCYANCAFAKATMSAQCHLLKSIHAASQFEFG